MLTTGTTTAGTITDAVPLLLLLLLLVLPPFLLSVDGVGDDPGDVPMALAPDWVPVAEMLVDWMDPDEPALVVGDETLVLVDDEEVVGLCGAAVVVSDVGWVAGCDCVVDGWPPPPPPPPPPPADGPPG